MRDSKFIDGLALLGVLIVILGVSSAANRALAADSEPGLILEVATSIQN